jgi:hypothetical protein
MTARRQSYSELKRLADEFAVDNARLRARLALLENPPLPKTALKLAAYNAGIRPERLRRWCEAGKVVAELINHQWFINEISLADYMGRIGLGSGSRQIKTVEDHT